MCESGVVCVSSVLPTLCSVCTSEKERVKISMYKGLKLQGETLVSPEPPGLGGWEDIGAGGMGGWEAGAGGLGGYWGWGAGRMRLWVGRAGRMGLCLVGRYM